MAHTPKFNESTLRNLMTRSVARKDTTVHSKSLHKIGEFANVRKFPFNKHLSV